MGGVCRHGSGAKLLVPFQRLRIRVESLILARRVQGRARDREVLFLHPRESGRDESGNVPGAITPDMQGAVAVRSIGDPHERLAAVPVSGWKECRQHRVFGSNKRGELPRMRPFESHP